VKHCNDTIDIAIMQAEIQNISPIKQRILLFADTLGISKRKFYENIGVSRGTLESTSGITEDVMAKFIAKYSEINLSWLLVGEGEMLKSKATLTNIPDNGIPLIPDQAMAGILQGDISVMELECERYVVPAFRGADFLIPVKGSSMYPKYSSGDIVACKKIPLTDLFFQWNKVYVLDTVQGPIIKRVAKGSDPDHILAVSENTKYEPFELHISQLRAVAIVMGVIRLE
jgi:SOS-response transcriptional repressor LexA